MRHLDGSRTNDAADNLAWSSHAENCKDKVAHGTAQRGAANANSKLTEEQAMEAIDRLSAGELTPHIALSLGVPKSVIYNIKYGKTWAWLKETGTAI